MEAGVYLTDHWQYVTQCSVADWRALEPSVPETVDLGGSILAVANLNTVINFMKGILKGTFSTC